MQDAHLQALAADGFTLVPSVFRPAEIDAFTTSLEAALASPMDATAVRVRDSVYAARNVLELWPASTTLWRRPLLLELLTAALGPRFGLVRGLYFDKPPDRTWALPWHKDLTIAVREHRTPPDPFAKPTRKAGIAHVEATTELLQSMLTLRLHLDDVTALNGPMAVLPGSHLVGKSMHLDEATARPLLASRGDVLLIRPLVAHNSTSSHPDSTAHRRILHLEFAACPELPAGYQWHTFLPVG